MNVSPNEAEEALAAIQSVMQRTRHSIASSGAYATLIATGIVWLVGFTCTQFLPAQLAAYVWIGISVLGSAVGTLLGIRAGRRVRSPSTNATAKQIGLFWLLLVLYAIATIAVAGPMDGKERTVLIVLFIMIGQLAMGLLFSFATVWWVLPITALVLIGYFFWRASFICGWGPGRGWDDRPRPVHPFQVVNYGRV